MNHAEMKDLLALHALGAVDAAAAAAIEAHAAGCADCASELADLRELGGLLAHAATPVAPPPALRSRILAALPEQAPRAPDVRDIRERIKRPPRRPAAAWWIAAAASIAAGAALITALDAQRQARSLQAELIAAQARADEAARLEQRLAAATAELQAEQARGQFLASATTTMVTLTGTPDAPNARLRLAYDRGSGRAMLFGAELPPAPAGKAYQLWFIAGGKPLPGRVFNPGAPGDGAWDETIPADGRDATLFAVTLEEAAGAQSPTSAILLTGTPS